MWTVTKPNKQILHIDTSKANCYKWIQRTYETQPVGVDILPYPMYVRRVKVVVPHDRNG